MRLYASSGARSRPVQRWNWIPNIYGSIEYFNNIWSRILLSFSCVTTNSENKFVKQYSQGHTESRLLHGCLFKHVHVWIYLPTALRDFPSLRNATHHVYKAWLQLDWAEANGKHGETIDLFFNKALELEVQKINVIGAWLHEVDTILVFVSVSIGDTRLVDVWIGISPAAYYRISWKISRSVVRLFFFFASSVKLRLSAWGNTLRILGHMSIWWVLYHFRYKG